VDTLDFTSKASLRPAKLANGPRILRRRYPRPPLRRSRSSLQKKTSPGGVFSPPPPSAGACVHGHSRGHSDVIFVGYGNDLSTRNSSAASDAGSKENTSSASSSGLRRKRILVDVFLRGAA